MSMSYWWDIILYIQKEIYPIKNNMYIIESNPPKFVFYIPLLLPKFSNIGCPNISIFLRNFDKFFINILNI